MSKCWRCKQMTTELFGNGMCADCYVKCSKAAEEEETQNWEDGEPR
jgi:hypothetical protein